MTGMRAAPAACKECTHVGVIRAKHGNSQFQICELYQEECATSVEHCPLAAKYELVVADYSRLLAFDLFRNRL